MTRFERDKDVILDILAECTGVGIGDNSIYYCHEIECGDCLMESACSKPHKGVLVMHKWLEENLEKQNEDIMNFLYDIIAVDKRDNSYINCVSLSCQTCLFDKHCACTELRREYLNEDV